MDEPQYRVLGDQPYAGDDDPLGFAAIASRLETLILASRASTPFAVGIQGSWGCGKSTLMGRLRRRLEQKRPGLEVRTVSYNAWTAEGEDVLQGLVKSVLLALDPNILRRALRNKKLMSWARLAVSVVAGFFRVGGVVDEAWKRLSVDASTRNQLNDLVREAMDEWIDETTELGPNRMIVVFIDDLDRCSSENVLRVFEGLKLYLDAPGFVFVIGYDEAVVTQAVVDRNQAGGHATGRDYVEKIIQIVFRIPQPADDEVARLLDGLLDQSGTTGLFDEPARTLVIDRNSRNPRRMKRFVNRFVIDNELDETSRGMRAELLVKLLLIETYYPEFTAFFAVTERVNPIHEFLLYASARYALRRDAQEGARETIEAAFGVYEMTVPENASSKVLLEMLEAEAPEPFLRLARDDSFLSLVDGLRDAEDQQQILLKVRGRTGRPTAGRGPDFDTVTAENELALTLIGGQRIIWIDDYPENNAAIVDLLRSHGAEVELATTGDYTIDGSMLRADLLISDIGRGGRAEAGFEDLERFRTEDIYAGPAIFYTARVSKTRRERAASLGAVVASGEEELVRAIAEVLAPKVAR